MSAGFLDEARRLDLVAWRRDLHRHPELAFAEVRTAEIVARHLRELGFAVTTGVAKTGVVGLLNGGKPGPVVMLRFDMDALPVAEENTHEFVSETPGVMHACGHDGHVAIGIGTAALLARHRDELAGSVKLVFQPGEEGAGGAQAMIEAGALDDPRPEVALGLHIASVIPSGTVAAGAGPVMASGQVFRATITGRGGHGGMPDQSVDALLAAAHAVTTLQSIVSRNVRPTDAAVVSVCTFRAGTSHNVIAERAELIGTIRTFEESTREVVVRRVREIIEGTARTFGAEAEVTFNAPLPAVVNDAAVAACVRAAAARVVGAERVSAEQRWTASEDMARYLREVPGCFFFLGGARTPEEKPHHNPRFDFDEAVLAQGVAIMCETVAELCNPRERATAADAGRGTGSLP